MTTRPAHAPALDGATLTFTSNHPYIHTHTHDGFIQTTLWTSCLEILSSLWEVLLRFSSYLLYRCLLRLWGPQSSERSYAVSGSFLTCGMMLLETKWILFMWAQLQRAWPRACPRPGSALLCSGLATKCVSLSCGPWPPDAFPDPGNRINTSARALGSHSRIHSCPLTRPSPVQSSPTQLAASPLQLNQRWKRAAGDFLWSFWREIIPEFIQMFLGAWRVLVSLCQQRLELKTGAIFTSFSNRSKAPFLFLWLMQIFCLQNRRVVYLLNEVKLHSVIHFYPENRRRRQRLMNLNAEMAAANILINDYSAGLFHD